MTLLVAMLGMLGTALVGGAAAALVLRGPSVQAPGRNALILGCAYPLGALIVVAWMYALAALHVAASSPVAALPVVAGLALGAWRAAKRRQAANGRRFVDAAWGRSLDAGERWMWRALVAWLALRFAMLAFEAVSRPPLPWEAWLHAAGRAHVWYALRAPAVFVPEPLWWNGAGYLAGFSGGSAFTPALDAWTTFALGGFDDTVVHAPWLMFWLSQPPIVYAALRTAGAKPLHALVAATFVATLPLPNAHAALGGTAVLVLATCYLAALVLAWRAAHSRSRGEALLALSMAAGMVVAGGPVAGVWLATLIPLSLALVSPAMLRKALAALVVVAAIATVVIAQYKLFAPPGLQDVPAPGLAALLQHAFLLGNWHVMPYAALACAVLGAATWNDARWLPLTGVVAAGLLAVIALATSSAGYRLLGAAGIVGQATLAFAPVLTLWTVLIANATWQRQATPSIVPVTKAQETAPSPDPAPSGAPPT